MFHISDFSSAYLDIEGKFTRDDWHRKSSAEPHLNVDKATLLIMSVFLSWSSRKDFNFLKSALGKRKHWKSTDTDGLKTMCAHCKSKSKSQLPLIL